MEHEPNPAFLKSLSLWSKLREIGVYKTKGKETISLLSHDVKFDENDLEIFVPGDYCYVSSEVFKGLTNPAILMVSKIMRELEYNNSLWYFDRSKNSRKSGVITELLKKDILFKTGTPDIHLVNPFLIRKGRIGAVIIHTALLLQNASRVTTDHIKPLKNRGKSKINGLDFLNA